mgnify:CR=1 FL=1
MRLHLHRRHWPQLFLALAIFRDLGAVVLAAGLGSNAMNAPDMEAKMTVLESFMAIGFEGLINACRIVKPRSRRPR